MSAPLPFSAGPRQLECGRCGKVLTRGRSPVLLGTCGHCAEVHGALELDAPADGLLEMIETGVSREPLFT